MGHPSLSTRGIPFIRSKINAIHPYVKNEYNFIYDENPSPCLLQSVCIKKTLIEKDLVLPLQQLLHESAWILVNEYHQEEVLDDN